MTVLAAFVGTVNMFRTCRRQSIAIEKVGSPYRPDGVSSEVPTSS